MTQLGIEASVNFNSYSVGINQGSSQALNYYSYTPYWLPLQIGALGELELLSFIPIEAPILVGIVGDLSVISYSPNIPINLLNVLSLPFTPLPIGFDQSLSYLSLQDAITINLIDVLSVPTIEYFLGFNESLNYDSQFSGIGFNRLNLNHFSLLPRGFDDSLAELLGKNYYQDANEIRIKISDLLIADTSKPQYLLAAIIFNALGAFMFSKKVNVEYWDTRFIDDERYTAIIVKTWEEE